MINQRHKYGLAWKSGLVAWKNGKTVKPDGSVRVGKSADGRSIKVHQDKKGLIHGCPIPLEK